MAAFEAWVDNSTNLADPPFEDFIAWEEITIAADVSGILKFQGTWDIDVDYEESDLVIAENGNLYVSKGGTPAGTDPMAEAGLTPASIQYHGVRAGYRIYAGTPITKPPAVAVAGYNMSPALFFQYEGTPGTPLVWTWEGGGLGYMEAGLSTYTPVYKTSGGAGGGPIGSSAHGASPMGCDVPASGKVAIELPSTITSVEIPGTPETITSGWVQVSNQVLNCLQVVPRDNFWPKIVVQIMMLNGLLLLLI